MAIGEERDRYPELLKLLYDMLGIVFVGRVCTTNQYCGPGNGKNLEGSVTPRSLSHAS